MSAHADVTYVVIKGEASRSDLEITEIKLSPFSLNQYPEHRFEFSDIASIETQKITLESLGLSDQQTKDIAKIMADTIGFSDEVSVLFAFARSFADSSTITDISVIAFDKSVAETFSILESQEKSVSLGKENNLSISDTSSHAFDKSVSSGFSVSVSDFFAYVATYARSFNDAFGLDELVSIESNFNLEKTNIFSLTESFSYELKAGHNAVLNTSAINTYTINS